MTSMTGVARLAAIFTIFFGLGACTTGDQPATVGDSMSNDVQWILELDVKDSHLENFKTVMNDMISATQSNEPGAINYEWFISDDGRQCHIYERYVDSAAVITHLENFNVQFAERLFATSTPAKLTVYGNPNTEVRNALAGLGAIHMEEIGGFAR